MIETLQIAKSITVKILLVVFVCIPTTILAFAMVPFALAWKFAVNLAEDLHEYTTNKLDE